jgi:putative RNA 2'-phosphotransferase
VSPATPKQLSRFVHYILGRHPEKFAVILDHHGYVTVKTLLKVLHEEDGWRHVRLGHLKEALLTLPAPDFEITDNRVRAVNRDHLPMPEPATILPKLLHTAIRNRAHPVVMEKGIRGTADAPVLLFADISLARRYGHRLDPSPVFLAVNTGQAQGMGVGFWTAGEGMFSAAHIPIGAFTGPPAPKEPPAPPERKPPPPAPPPTPGSFVIGPEDVWPAGGGSGRKQGGGKRKRKRQKPPWRR